MVGMDQEGSYVDRVEDTSLAVLHMALGEMEVQVAHHDHPIQPVEEDRNVGDIGGDVQREGLGGGLVEDLAVEEMSSLEKSVAVRDLEEDLAVVDVEAPESVLAGWVELSPVNNCQ
jgi:hypothetical protein